VNGRKDVILYLRVCIFFVLKKKGKRVRVIRVSHRASVNSLLSRVSF